MSELRFTTKIELGKIVCNDAIRSIINSMNGKRVEVAISQSKRKRSNPQNAYYWGVVVPLVRQMFTEAGNIISNDNTHEYLKVHVGKLDKTIITPDGEVKNITKSTTELSTMEFEVYLEQCRAFAAEYGCVIPLPNEMEIN